jgi:hypothetical protein
MGLEGVETTVHGLAKMLSKAGFGVSRYRDEYPYRATFRKKFVVDGCLSYRPWNLAFASTIEFDEP